MIVRSTLIEGMSVLSIACDRACDCSHVNLISVYLSVISESRVNCPCGVMN